ncbi:MAG: M28 family peptidase [Candidatus Latescibacteria bacterium]|nr:M28 family peptidase [Candidatus Latescibacterota bacterium]
MTRGPGSLLLAASAAAVLAAPAAARAVDADGDGDGQAMLERVRTLSAEELQGRGNGTAAALAAADTIERWFAAAGLAPPPGCAQRFSDFALGGQGLDGRPARNVLGWSPGRGALVDELVVIGAHYDHLGPALGPDGATVAGFYPGAEDNASGVAVMVELARRLHADATATDRCAILFAAFAGEEVGLQGAAAALRAVPLSGRRVRLMLNLDSVGRLRGDRLYVGGLGSSPRLRPLVQDVNRAHGLVLELSDGGWDASDHVAFNAAGIPVLFLFTGAHPQYHSVADRWELVEPRGLARVADFARDLAAAVVTTADDFPYATQAALPSAGGERGQTRAWLGTIPDFVENAGGVKLSGVMPGSPAEEAGLAAGDVLVAMEGSVVADLAGLSALLQAHGAGETVTVTVERDGGRRDFAVTLRARPR